MNEVLGTSTGGPFGRRRDEPGHAPKDYARFRDLIQRMLDFDPATRLTAAEAVIHHFLRKQSAPNDEAAAASASLNSRVRLGSAHHMHATSVAAAATALIIDEQGASRHSFVDTNIEELAYVRAFKLICGQSCQSLIWGQKTLDRKNEIKKARFFRRRRLLLDKNNLVVAAAVAAAIATVAVVAAVAATVAAADGLPAIGGAWQRAAATRQIFACTRMRRPRRAVSRRAVGRRVDGRRVYGDRRSPPPRVASINVGRWRVAAVDTHAPTRKYRGHNPAAALRLASGGFWEKR